MVTGFESRGGLLGPGLVFNQGAIEVGLSFHRMLAGEHGLTQELGGQVNVMEEAILFGADAHGAALSGFYLGGSG